MTTFYMQAGKDGRVFLDAIAPAKPESIIKVAEADDWKAARKSLVHTDLDEKYVVGLTYKEGHGYFQ